MLKKSISGRSPSMSTEFCGWDMKGEKPFATDPMAVDSAKEVVTGCRPQVEVACCSVDKATLRSFTSDAEQSQPQTAKDRTHTSSRCQARASIELVISKHSVEQAVVGRPRPHQYFGYWGTRDPMRAPTEGA